jgi:RNA polymerase sigma-70 factor (ECF subfamily)
MHQVNESTGGVDRDFDAAWQMYRPRLLAQATRTLHDEVAAEDVVQEAFRRLSAVPLDEIHDTGAWLSVVVRRLCLNRLRSAFARHEGSVEGDFPADIFEADPADRVTLDDEVQLALAVVLDRLSPPERTAFVLHDVFGFPFDAVGAIVGRTPTACRQLASRARRSIRTESTAGVRANVDPDHHRQVVERFIAACTGGDIKALMEMLDPQVDGHAELIGFGTVADLTGRPAVAQRLIGMCGPGTGVVMVPVSIEDEPGVVAYSHGRLAAVIRFRYQQGFVSHLRSFVVPPSRR